MKTPCHSTIFESFNVILISLTSPWCLLPLPVAVINFNPTTYTVAEGTVVTVIAVSDKDFEKATTIMFMTMNGTAIGMCCHDNK